MGDAIGGALTFLGHTVGAAANLITANKQNKLNQWMQQKQFDHADAAATTAYLRQRELVNDMNLYNDPSNVRRRLEAAGFNPYLAVDNGGATVSAASANVQQANTPSATYTPNYYEGLGDHLANSISTGLQNLIAMKRLENETKIADAQAENLKAQASQTGLQTEFDRKTFDTRVTTTRWDEELRASQINETNRRAMREQVETELVAYKKDNLKASTAELEAEKDVLEAKHASQLILNKFLPDKEAAEIANLVANTRKAYLDGDYVSVLKGLAKFQADTARMLADAEKLKAGTYDWERRNITNKDWFQAGSGIVNRIIDGIVTIFSKGGNLKPAKPVPGFNSGTGGTRPPGFTF